MEAIQKFVEQYWVIIAGLLLYWQNPDALKNVLAKFTGGLIKPPESSRTLSDLELVRQLAELNQAKGYGAEAEIQALFSKFMTGGKPRT